MSPNLSRDASRCVATTLTLRRSTDSSCLRLQILRGFSINIYDLIDAQRTGNPVKTHPSKEALREYTLEKHMIFPLKSAKKNRFLKILLTEMFL